MDAGIDGRKNGWRQEYIEPEMDGGRNGWRQK
jgi:hypothetical protein